MAEQEHTQQGDLAADLDEMVLATEQLCESVRRLDDAAARGPSLLPGWTRAHVVTHLARNADGMVNLLTWARTGIETPMYASREARDADIEAGAGRSAGDLELDLNESAERLLTAFAEPLPTEALDRVVRTGSGAEFPAREIPLRRTREVEIHHVDLDLGYTPAHWPRRFVQRTLDELAGFFREQRDCPVGTLVAIDGPGRWRVAAHGPELSGPASALLAWLTGRSGGDGLLLDGSPGPVPPAPRWT